MNVNKCTDIWQFYPLLNQMFNEDKNIFEQFVRDNFVYPDKVFEMFESGADNGSAQTDSTEEGVQIDETTTDEEYTEGEDVNVEGGISRPSHTDVSTLVDTDTILLGPVRLTMAQSEFKRKMVSSAIIDLNTGEVINPNENNVLNNKINEYKLSLLNALAVAVGHPTIASMEEAQSIKDTLPIWEGILQKFATLKMSNPEAFSNHLKEYIILKNFDRWLSTNAPFIKVKTTHFESSPFDAHRYLYTGPSVKMFQSFSNDEYMDAQKYGLSDLVKIIVDAFPEYTIENGKWVPTEGTQIGVSGFFSIGSQLKEFAQTNHAEAWYAGVDRFNDVSEYKGVKIPKIFVNYLQSEGAITTKKLNGLMFLMSKLPDDIKRIFSHTIDKAVASEYRAADLKDSSRTDHTGYTTYEYKGRAKNYRERPVKLKELFVKEFVNGASVWLQEDKTILAKYGITYNGAKVMMNGDVLAEFKDNKFICSPNKLNKVVAEEFVSDILHYSIPSEYEETAQLFAKGIAKTSGHVAKDWIPLALFAIYNSAGSKLKAVPDNLVKQVSKILAIIDGSETISVVKNHDGNNLPLYQTTCLAYRHKDIKHYHSKSLTSSGSYDEQRISSNLIYKNIDKMLTPQCRTDGIHNDQARSFSKMNALDSLGFSMIFDFYKPLFPGEDSDSDNDGIIALQAHTYADKSKQLLQRFDLASQWKFFDADNKPKGFEDSDGTFNLGYLLKNVCLGDETSYNTLKSLWRHLEQTQMNATKAQIIADYNKVFNPKGEYKIDTLEDVNTLIENVPVEKIRQAFRSHGVSFIENYHAVKFGGKTQVNECICDFDRTLNDDALWEKFVADHEEEMKNSAANMPAKFWRYTGIEKKELESKIPNIAKAYFIANNLLCGQYNRMMVGDFYLHDNKSKSSDLVAAAASRYVSQIKRMVIYGATTHTYAQGLKNGVPKKVKVACIEDLQSDVQNMLGETSSMDACDGSGLTNPYYSRMENNSLLDARVGPVKKTIMHDVNSRGIPRMLKWAEYEVTNMKRRDSWKSDVRYEHIFKKMNSERINIVGYNKVFDDVYYYDPDSGAYYKAKIEFEAGQIKETLWRVDASGNEIVKIKDRETRTANTLYELDQIFGGAWSMSKNSKGFLEYSESSLDQVFEIIVDNDLRSNMIGIVTNKSAMKVGIENLNSRSAWTDNSDLWTIEMSTEFGGLQMDADHELEDADVTEMTQMISALVQNGLSMEIARQIYTDIGKYCADSISDIKLALSGTDSKEKIYEIFGKAMIEVFASGEKETLGLAQAFVEVATRSAQECGISMIPFSSSSINGLFNSTVTTTLVKKAIRRHYSGVAAVLNPSFGSIQVFNVGGATYKYPELAQWYKNNRSKRKFQYKIGDTSYTWQLSDLFDKNQMGDEINPTYTAVDHTTYLDFEDTIVWQNSDGSWSTPMKITDYSSYWNVRKAVKAALDNGAKVYIKQLAPKNLKGADTKFTLAATDGIGATVTRNTSMFETVYAQLLYATYNIKANTTEDVVNQVKATLADLLGVANDAAWEEAFNVKYKDILVNAFGNLGMNSEYSYKRLRRRLAKSQQKFLGELHKAQENISESGPIYTFNMDGAEYNISSVEVVPAQIIMGRYYAKQFGLTSQDNVASILSNPKFFEQQSENYYTNEISDNPFDFTIYDGAGDQMHVLYDPDGSKIHEFASQLTKCNDFLVVNGKAFYKEKPFCDAEGKQFWTYSDGNKKYTLIVVKNINDFSSVIKNDWTDYTECHYKESNAKILWENVHGGTIQDGVVTYTAWDPTKKEEVLVTVNISTPEGIESLNKQGTYNKRSYIKRVSKHKMDAFKKSLNFIGTRIPCQSMQSFAPMQVVAFSDSDLNEVFVPTNIMWLEGSDLDIDKQYILGYTISDSGRIFSGNMNHHKEDCLKNNVVENIWKTVTDPRNQINLTQPISTDDFKAVAARSNKGSLANKMSYYNPVHKYSMQVENMVGRDCIGSVATALKGFFALTYMYNMRMNEMCDAIESGNIDKAERLFNRYFTQPLANVNVERLDYVTELLIVPEDDQTPEAVAKRTFREKLLDLKDKIEDQEDMSMLMGQLLNAATDNAKELILKKINADANWIDFYTSAFMRGEKLESEHVNEKSILGVSDVMLDEITEAVFAEYDSSFLDNSVVSKTGFLKRVLNSINVEKTKNQTAIKLRNQFGAGRVEAVLEDLLDRAQKAEETRILGRFLKINQGLYTNRSEMMSYLLDIVNFVDRAFLESTNYETLCDIYKILADEDVAPPSFDDLAAVNLSGLIDANLLNDKNYRKRASEIVENEIKSLVQANHFDVYRFASDKTYQSEMIEKYDSHKKYFNILEAVAVSPHFNNMFNMVSVNEDILSTLSVRNKLESLVVNEYVIKHLTRGNSNKVSNSVIRELQSRVDDVLRTQWIVEAGIKIPIKKGQEYWDGFKYVKASEDHAVPMNIDSPNALNTLRNYIEKVIIPKAKEQHPNNVFLKNIVFGAKDGLAFWKPSINMTTISQSIKNQAQYDDMLEAFTALHDVTIDATPYSIADWIYLYNMIVNRDKFGTSTFTRFFEGLVSKGKDSFAFNFANWLDRQDPQNLFKLHQKELLKFYDEEDSSPNSSYKDHFGIGSKIKIEDDSKGFYVSLQKEAKLNEDQIRECMNRMDQVYTMDVTLVGKSTLDTQINGFYNGGSKVVVFAKNFDEVSEIAKLKAGDALSINGFVVKVETPLTKIIGDKDLHRIGVKKVEPKQPVQPVSADTRVSNFHAFSGAADGADTEWKEVATLWGIDTTDYTIESYDALDSNWKNTIEEAYQKAVKNLGRFAYDPNTVGGKLVRRDYLQARKADAVFAVGKIVAPGEIGLPNSSGKTYENKTSHDVVDGGTGYAVQMAIDMGKPVHVFDPYRKGWYIWNGSSFVKEEVPTLTPNFAAIGSRNLVELPGLEWVRAKLAIRRVFEKTAEKYGWDKSKKAPTDLLSFNSLKDMKEGASKIPNGVITIRPTDGSKNHYGNPFTHKTGTSATIILPTVKDAVSAYGDWLLGETTFTTSTGETIDISNVEPERRKWIQDQISSGALKGKTLIYHTTKIENPSGYKKSNGEIVKYFSHEFPSHAHVLHQLVLAEWILEKPEIIQTVIERTGLLDQSVFQETPETSVQKTLNIYYTTGENAEFSNFAHRPFTPGDITIDGVWINYKDEFKNVEAAFQAAKVFFVDDQNLSYEDNRSNSQILYKLYSASGSEAKKLGKQIKGLNVEAWDKAAPEVMRFLLQKSFEQNPVAAKKLLDTGDAILTHTQDKSKWGTEFPKLLMEVRSSLKENKLNLIEVKYTPKGKTEQTYFVDKSTWQIFNSKGDEVFKHDAANVGVDRNKIHALMYIALGQARTYKWKDGNTYTVHENGIVMTPTGHRYSDPIQESQIYRAAYPEKFTTEPIVPVETVEDKTQDGEIQLTRDQKMALDAIVDYVKSPLDPSNCAICINGFAGTGKTTLINYVLQELVDQGEWRTQGVVVSAVSHQATLNIFNKIHVPGAKIKPQTIASFNVSGKSDEGDNFSYNIKHAMADKGPGEPNIMFVDEVSMLTTDDVTILLHHASNYGMKLVFIGDINQLPPIEKDPNTGQDILQSVVFDKKLPIKHVKLQERVRQGKDSPILEYSDQFRTEDRRDSSIKDTTIGKEGAVIFDGSSAEKYIECFKHAKENSLPYFIKVCVPNHTLRNTENTAIHKALFDDPDLQILPGENILLYGNSNPTEDSIDGFKFNLATIINYCNSQSLTVDSITSLGLKTYKFGNASITLDLVEITPKESAWGMSRPEPFVTCRTIREMHRLFGPKVNGQNGCIMAQIREYLNKKFGVTPHNNKTWDQRDPEVRLFHELETIVPLDYGYASTIHKAQGSTYDIVITPSYDKYFGQKDKMAYTAVTRARNVVIVQDSGHSFDGNILDVNKTIEDNRKAPKSDTTLSISPNPQKVSDETKAQVREFIQAINSPYLKEVTDEDLAGVDDYTADADGFVKDGVIYINTKHATMGTVIHELGHLYLGALKSDDRKRKYYYDILSEMHDECDLWKELRGSQFYANKRGSDFDEEVAARLIEGYMSGAKMSYRDWKLAQRLVSITGIDMKSLPKPEKMQWLSENYKIKQQVATLKNQLYKDEVIKDIDC